MSSNSSHGINFTFVRGTRHSGHCWRSRDELINGILQWTSSHGRAKAGRPARTYIQQLCTDTGYSLEDLPGAMDNWNGWGEGQGSLYLRCNIMMIISSDNGSNSCTTVPLALILNIPRKIDMSLNKKPNWISRNGATPSFEV